MQNAQGGMQNADPAVVPSARSLALATVLSAAVAAVLLVTVILPAEYGVDPLGAGRRLGLYRAPAPEVVMPEGTLTADAAPLPAGSATLARSPTPYRTDEMSITLKPGEGGEIKAVMGQGQHFVYAWTAAGGVVDVDMHGEALNEKDEIPASYWKDEGQSADQGRFTAPVPGRFGWFWQNLNDDPVTVTVKTSGFYERLMRP